MGRLRLDIVNDEMVVTLLTEDKVENGAFGKVSKIMNVDDLGRETYGLAPLVGGESAGEIVFVAHDGHRYESKKIGSALSPIGGGKFYEELNDGFDVSVEAGESTRGYFLSRRDIISVEPHVLTGEDPVTEIAECELKAGEYLKAGEGYILTKAQDSSDAIAVVDGIEKWCGYVVYVIRFL